MKRKLLLRSLTGFPVGLALGHVITIGISLVVGDGRFYPCVPELVTLMDSEIRAVLLQALLCGVLGTGFAASSVIWEMDDWGLAKQTGIYFLAISVIMMPIAYGMYWMEHSLKGVLSYFGIFVLIFAVIWILQYVIAKRNVERWNETLRKRKGNRNG